MWGGGCKKDSWKWTRDENGRIERKEWNKIEMKWKNKIARKRGKIRSTRLKGL